MRRLEYHCCLHIVFVTLATAYNSAWGLSRTLFLKEGSYAVPTEIRCPLAEDAFRNDGRYIDEAYDKYRQGSLHIMWKKRSCQSSNKQLLAAVLVHGGERTYHNISGVSIAERKVQNVGSFYEYPLALSTVDFEDCGYFDLEWEMFFEGRLCRDNCVIEYQCRFRVLPSTAFAPKLWFSSPPIKEDFFLRLDPPAGIPKQELQVKLENVTREGMDLHSIVGWRLFTSPDQDNVTLLDSSDNYGSLVVFWSTKRNEEEAIIELRPNESWKGLVKLKLEVTAKTHCVSMPWLTISRMIYFHYGPAIPSLRIHNGIIKRQSGVVNRLKEESWLSDKVPIHAECLTEHLGQPFAQLIGNVTGWEGLTVERTGSLEWRGTLVLAEKHENFVTFACESRSEELSVERSVKKSFPVAYFDDIRIVLKPIVDEFDQTAIRCDYRGNPLPKLYRWERIMKSGEVQKLTATADNVLRIFGHNVSRWNHFVGYRCAATNPITGESKVSAPAILKVRFEADSMQCEEVKDLEALVDEEDKLSARFNASAKFDTARDYDNEIPRRVTKTRMADSPSALNVVCTVRQYPLMRLDEFVTFVRVLPYLGFYLGSVNVTSATVKDVDDPQSALRSFLVDIRVSDNAECRGFCFVGTLKIVDPQDVLSEEKIQRQLFPISFVNLMKSSEPLIEENNDSTSELILPIVIPLLVLLAILALIVFLWIRAHRSDADQIEDIENWEKGVKSLFAPPLLHYHSSLLYDRVLHAFSAYDSQKQPARQRSSSDESDASKDTNVSILSTSSNYDCRLSISGGSGEIKTNGQAGIADYLDDSCFDSLPYDVNTGPSTVTCTALVHRQPSRANDYVADLNDTARFNSFSDSEPGNGYLNIIPSPYVNIVMGEIRPRASDCPSLVTTASDIYVNLPKWEEMGQRGRMPSSGSPDVSFGVVNLDSIERRSARSSSDACPTSLPLSSLEDEAVGNEITKMPTRQNFDADTDDVSVSQQDDHVFVGSEDGAVGNVLDADVEAVDDVGSERSRQLLFPL